MPNEPPREIELGYYSNQPFPDKIILKRVSIGNNTNEKTKELYFKRVYADVIVTVADEDHSVGNSKCSNCNNVVDIFVKFCPYCGAKIKGRIYNKQKDENNS